MFRGADNPLKLKGVKYTRGYAAVVWFEEPDQFDGIDAVRSISNSLRHGGEGFWIFNSYNPPRTMYNWVNREKLEWERRADTLVRSNFYLDVVDELAQVVIAGRYGVGEVRRKVLGSRYAEVQRRVNQLLS